MARILITGCNRGIGLELSRQYAARGDEVLAACRKASSGLSSLDVEIISGVDVTSDRGTEQLKAQLGNRALDLLLNNAGVLSRDQLDSFDPDDMAWQFQVNAIGPLRVTRALLPNLESGSRVGIVTSRMGSIADNGSGGYYGYRMSKAAVNMAGMSLANDLRPRGIAVALLHPGMVATEMTGMSGIPVSEAASGLIERMDELNPDSSGGFWHANGEVLPW